MYSKNWASWFDNKPKYNIGDIVYTGEIVSIITKVISAPYTDEHKEYEEKRISEQSNCCGRKGKGIRSESNKITYEFIDGVQWNEHRILVAGLNGINEYIKELQEEITELTIKIEDVAQRLGYSNNY